MELCFCFRRSASCFSKERNNDDQQTQIYQVLTTAVNRILLPWNSRIRSSHVLVRTPEKSGMESLVGKSQRKLHRGAKKGGFLFSGDHGGNQVWHRLMVGAAVVEHDRSRRLAQ